MKGLIFARVFFFSNISASCAACSRKIRMTLKTTQRHGMAMQAMVMVLSLMAYFSWLTTPRPKGAGILGIQMLNIRRAKLFDTSQSIASAGRTPLWTDTLSMSCHRLSSGQNVFRSVLVSVQMLAAVFAYEDCHELCRVSTAISPTCRRSTPASRLCAGLCYQVQDRF